MQGLHHHLHIAVHQSFVKSRRSARTTLRPPRQLGALQGGAGAFVKTEDHVGM